MVTFPGHESPEGTNGVKTPEQFARLTPLYRGIPVDYRQTPRPFTVAVAGPGRHDGEKPFTYVVEAESTEEAWAKALAWSIAENAAVDAYVVADESFEGVPGANWPHAWHDLRPELARQRELDELADTATALVDAFEESTAAHHGPDGSVREEREADIQRLTNVFLQGAIVVVRRLVELNGRDE